MALQVISGGSGQLYGGTIVPQQTYNSQPAGTAPANFTNTANPNTANLQFAPAPTASRTTTTTAPTGPTAAQIAAQQAAAAQAAQQQNLAASYADQASQYQQQLNGLDGQQQVGLNNLQNSYNQSHNQLANGQAQAETQYKQQGQQNTSNYSDAYYNALGQTRSSSNALQRLLGMNGAGNSSAATEQAPYAAALAGSQLTNGAQKTYGQNQQTLDTNWQDTTRKYKDSFDNLDQQNYQNTNDLKGKIATSRQGLLQQIAQANMNHDMALGANYQTAANNQSGLRQQASDLLNQITQLGNQYAHPVYQTQAVDYTPPSLSQYNLGSIAAPTTQQSPGTSDVSANFLSLLGQGKKDPYGNLIAA